MTTKRKEGRGVPGHNEFYMMNFIKKTDVVTVIGFYAKTFEVVTTPKHYHQKPLNHDEGHSGMHAWSLIYISSMHCQLFQKLDKQC